MRGRMTAALAALFALALSAPLYAQELPAGQKHSRWTGQPPAILIGSDSTRYLPGGTPTTAGRAAGQIDDIDRDRHFLIFEPNIMQTNGTGPAGVVIEDNCDSSAVYNTLGAQKLTLFLSPQFGASADSVWSALLSVEPRRHKTSAVDTITTYPWGITRVGSSAAGAPANVDTVGSFTDPTTIAQVQTGGPPSWSIPVVVKLRPGTNQPQGIAVDLQRNGVWFTASRTSIRICVVELYNASGVAMAAGPSINWRADLEITR